MTYDSSLQAAPIQSYSIKIDVAIPPRAHRARCRCCCRYILLYHFLLFPFLLLHCICIRFALHLHHYFVLLHCFCIAFASHLHRSFCLISIAFLQPSV
nr:MAG TPA: hypothetical protein [Caudoviricetes sp.]DAR22067.1 MAG TPA: hypothetical protein [Caudoviricetes sp.]